MPRAHRLKVQGGIFQVTQRCHNRAFLLRFARDRQAYEALMRTNLREFELSPLGYCRTCNHVHLLTGAQDKLQISGFMRDESRRPAEESGCGASGAGRTATRIVLDGESSRGQLGLCGTDPAAESEPRETGAIEEAPGLWALKEPAMPYGSEPGAKRSAKA